MLDCKPTLRKLYELVVHSVASSWYEVGLYLDVNYAVLDNIIGSTSTSVTAQCEDMLKRWLMRADRTGQKDRSWETLLDAVALSSGKKHAEDIKHRVLQLARGSMCNACICM